MSAGFATAAGQGQTCVYYNVLSPRAESLKRKKKKKHLRDTKKGEKQWLKRRLAKKNPLEEAQGKVSDADQITTWR